MQVQIADIPSFASLALDNDVTDSLQQYLNCLPLIPSLLSARSRHLLDLSGTALWNSCTRLARIFDERGGEGGHLNLLTQGISGLYPRKLHGIISSVAVQALSFLMLDSCVLRGANENISRYPFVKVTAGTNYWPLQIIQELFRWH